MGVAFTNDQTTKLAAGRMVAVDAQPFLGVALYALTPVVAPGLGTFAVDERWRLFVDPVIVDEWTVPQIAGVLLHEVGHVVRDHAERARVANVDMTTRLIWNVACDAEINDDLLADGVELPDGVAPARLGLPPGRAAEFYFDALRQRDDPPSHHDCGPGCHGVATESDGVALPIIDIVGVEPGEDILLRRTVALAVISYGRQAGSAPGGWQRWAEATLRPSLDWRVLLAGAVRRAMADVAGRADYSFGRPSRRRMPQVILPSLRRPLPAVAVVVDTSGSMDAASLGAAWAEVLGCLWSVGVRRDLLRVYAVDAQAHLVTGRLGVRAELPGGGGTDMGVGIEAALAGRPRPDVVVVLTDGYTPWPEAAPRSRVVIGLLRGDDGDWDDEEEWAVPPTPPWAMTIEIPLVGV
jgi:predicted metal-dependent peptidase